jgi:hypothetical protein
MGALWAWNAGEPIMEHALKLLALVLIVPTLIHKLRERKAKRSGKPTTGPQVSLGRLMAAKVSLVLVALLANAVLGAFTDNADYIVAVCLVIAPPLLGPRIHHLFLVPDSAAAGSPQPNGGTLYRGSQPVTPPDQAHTPTFAPPTQPYPTQPQQYGPPPQTYSAPPQYGQPYDNRSPYGPQYGDQTQSLAYGDPQYPDQSSRTWRP